MSAKPTAAEVVRKSLCDFVDREAAGICSDDRSRFADGLDLSLAEPA